ncbi:MAG: hypothetical protein PHQ59_04030 [Candidatus Daviesbacteria bacterium]|nr:hypothetical protein [Candidatus Daviesbacteria bacterium]
MIQESEIASPTILNRDNDTEDPYSVYINLFDYSEFLSLNGMSKD